MVPRRTAGEDERRYVPFRGCARQGAKIVRRRVTDDCKLNCAANEEVGNA
jgi:hypothetical protein